MEEQQAKMRLLGPCHHMGGPLLTRSLAAVTIGQLGQVLFRGSSAMPALNVRNVALAALVTVAIVALAVYLHHRSTKNITDIPPPTKVYLKVGYIPIAECAHMYVGVAKRFFEDEGIEVDLVPMKGGAIIIPALQRKDLDVGFTNVVSVVTVNSGLEPGSPNALVSLAGATYERPGHVNHALVTTKDSHVTLEDLGNTKTRIALNTIKNIEELMFRRFLDKNGITQTEFNIVTIGFPD